MLKLKVIIGSTRPARAADQVISWIVPVARAHGGFTVEVADLREWDLPMVPLRNNVIIPFVEAAFGPDGQPADHRTAAAAKILLDDLAWWGTTLRQARSAGTLPPPAAMRLRAASEGATR